MFVKYVGTNLYRYIILFMCLLFVSLVIFALLETYRIYIDGERCDRCNRENLRREYEKKIDRHKRWRHRFIAAAIIVFCMAGFLLYQKNKFAISEELVDVPEGEKENNGLDFPVLKRKTLDEMPWCEKELHMEWHDNENKEGEWIIDREVLEQYAKEVDKIFSAIPEKNDGIDGTNESDSIFMKKKKNFETLVNCNHKSLDSDKLWKGYKDGVEVCKVHESSENIFQTGVLAESACENADKSKKSRENCLLYVAGMVDQFEKFLEFRNKNIGEGLTASVTEVCFRIEKALYRVSKAYSGYDERIAQHCGLYAYSCSQYTMERTGIDDSNFLVYLNNSGLNCLNIVQYIKNERLCAELCQKELDRWEALEGRDWPVYKTERKTLEEIMKTRERLEDFTISN